MIKTYYLAFYDFKLSRKNCKFSKRFILFQIDDYI